MKRFWFFYLYGFLIFVSLLAFAFSSCAIFSKTTYVEEGTPVRLRETVEGVKVWIKEKDGTVITGKIDLLEGWFVLSMPEEDL